jgi:hypothetical protein
MISKETLAIGERCIKRRLTQQGSNGIQVLKKKGLSKELLGQSFFPTPKPNLVWITRAPLLTAFATPWYPSVKVTWSGLRACPFGYNYCILALLSNK